MEPEVFLEAIGERLLAIFETAVGWKADAGVQAHNRSLIAGTMAAYTFEVSHRRLFVKTYVDFLYGQRSETERRITEEEAVRIVQGGYAVLESAEYDDEEFLDA